MGAFRRRGKFFQIDFKDCSGVRVRETVYTDDQKVAENVLKKREVQVLEGMFFDRRKEKKITFEELANEVLQYSLKLRKSKEFFYYLIKKLIGYFGKKALCDITARDIVTYQEARVVEVSKATVNRELAVLKRIFNLGIKWGKVVSNPVKGIDFFKESRGRVRYLTQEEIPRLLTNCHGNLKNIVKTALLTGMRKEEILSLKFSNVDFDNNLIILEKTKNDEIREIPLCSELRELFWVLSTGKNQDEYLFTLPSGNRFKSVRTAFKTALDNAGISSFRFHDLRHTFASQCVMAGINILTVRELLGHKDIKMTMRYSHLAPQYKQDAIGKLESRICHCGVTGTTDKAPQKVESQITLTNIAN